MSASPIYVAIDTADLARAESLARAVAAHVGGLKLGLEFFMANGRQGVQALAALGLPIFLDLKLHDIPNTVSSALSALQGLGGGRHQCPCRRRAGDVAGGARRRGQPTG